MRNLTPRYVVSTAINKELNERLATVRKRGKFTVPKILEMGIEQAEFQISKEQIK